MGADASKLIRKLPPSLGVFSLRFNQNVLSLLHADVKATEAVRNAIKKYYTNGFRNVPPVVPGVSYEIELVGYKNDKEFWANPLMMVTCCGIIGALADEGYKLLTAPDIFVNFNDAELIFGRMKHKERYESICSVRFFNGNVVQSCLANGKVLDAVLRFANEYTIKNETYGVKSWFQTLTVEKNVFRPKTVEERAHLAAAINRLFSSMNKLGFKLLCNAALDGDQDVWFFYKPAKNPPDSDMEFCSFMLTETDKLLAVDCNPDMLDTIEKCIRDKWHKGLQSHDPKRKWVEFKFKGNPWRTPFVTKSETPLPRLFILDLLQSLERYGIELVCSTDISEEDDDKSLFIFSAPRLAPSRSVPRPFLAIEPMGANDLYLMNASNEVMDNLVKVFGTLIGQQQFKVDKPMKCGTQVIEISNNPWQITDAKQAFLARHVIIVVMAAMIANGWKVHASADIQGDVQPDGTQRRRKGRRGRASKPLFTIDEDGFKLGGTLEPDKDGEISADTHTIIFTTND